jgi:predicted SprT family Zn-dependent metalloprotease
MTNQKDTIGSPRFKTWEDVTKQNSVSPSLPSPELMNSSKFKYEFECRCGKRYVTRNKVTARNWFNRHKANPEKCEVDYTIRKG